MEVWYKMASAKKLQLPESYIYFYHTDEYFIIPTYPDNLSDHLQSNFRDQNALGRTAPMQSYANSGPRSIRINLGLHRDMMWEYNVGVSNVKYNISDGFGVTDVITSIGDDYIDVLVKKLQSVALPRYNADSKEIIPPAVAVRFADELFIKGIVNGGVGVDYKLPVVKTKYGTYRYSMINVDFTVTEVQPYDADTVGQLGSFRGLTAGLKSKMGF